MIKSIYTTFLALLISGVSLAQSFDTVRVMTYNLLYYGQVTSFCPANLNVINDKDEFLKTIAHHVNPDLMVVNEMGASDVYAERILVKSLNTDGVSKYARVSIQNNSFSDLVNGVFYNKNKFAVHAKTKVEENVNGSSIVRVIDVVTFLYKDPLLSANSDTTFLHVIAAHLKAGSNASDVTDRGLAAEAVMTYMQDNLQPGYYVMCGDLNLKTSNESAFQESATYGDYKLNDPINQLGTWNNSSTFSAIHTQSTRNTGSNSCFSGGGLDDRFDLILMSGQVIEDTGAVSYVDGSYHAVGQDGLHFNQDINAGANTSVPATVLTALYEMSDHLPVAADIKIKLIEADTTPESIVDIKLQNSLKVWQQMGDIRIDNRLGAMNYSIFNITGDLVATGSLKAGYQSIAAPNTAGVFILHCQSTLGIIAKKIVISH
jgi:hypothetical protein